MTIKKFISRALDNVARERFEQQHKHHFNLESDAGYKPGVLADAARAYIHHANGFPDAAISLWRGVGLAPGWFRPRDRRSSLVKAAAMLLAEIDALDYREQRNAEQTLFNKEEVRARIERDLAAQAEREKAVNVAEEPVQTIAEKSATGIAADPRHGDPTRQDGGSTPTSKASEALVGYARAKAAAEVLLRSKTAVIVPASAANDLTDAMAYCFMGVDYSKPKERSARDLLADWLTGSDLKARRDFAEFVHDQNRRTLEARVQRLVDQLSDMQKEYSRLSGLPDQGPLLNAARDMMKKDNANRRSALMNMIKEARQELANYPK